MNTRTAGSVAITDKELSDMPRARVRKKQATSAVDRSLPSGIPEGGVHVHTLERENQRTKVDGAHFHVFQLPDGSFVRTAEDGAHSHQVDDGDWISGGAHGHSVVLPGAGAAVLTEVSGCHSHDTQVDSTAFDGNHVHHLVLATGETIRSLSPDEHHILEGSPPQQHSPPAPPASQLAKTRDPEKLSALWEPVARALRFTYGEQLLTIKLGRDTANQENVEFTTVGSGALYPLDRAKAQLDELTQRLSGVVLGKGTLEYGIQQPDQKEFFINIPASELVGTLKLELVDGTWLASLTDEPPSVLRADTKLPALGVSALPTSLERDIPANVRYWECKSTKDAYTARDWLVDTGYFTRDAAIRRVDGVLRRVVVTNQYYLPDAADVTKASWGEKLTELLPKHVPVTSPFAEDDWKGALKAANEQQKFVVLDPPSDLKISLQELLERVSGTDYLIAADDTVDTRIAFAKAGRPFKLLDPTVHDRIFLMSTPVCSKDVAWVSPPSESQNKAAGRVYDRLKHTKILRDKGEESEQFVYGVVMEPDETDTYGDTETKLTIRTAAHNFMADFAVIGLQHSRKITSNVRILESAILPADAVIAGQLVKKGAWVMGLRIVNPVLWKGILDGTLTGFSIGGYGIREPINNGTCF